MTSLSLSRSGWNVLPLEVWLFVVQLLDLEEFLSLALVSKFGHWLSKQGIYHVCME
jgi:hypothetical protein